MSVEHDNRARLHKAAEPAPSRRWRPRFGMGSLMLVMLVFSVMAASASYMIRGLRSGGPARLTFLLLTLAAPLLLMVIVSVLHELVTRARRK